MSWSEDSFREKLEAQYTFPALYIFKFIVPLDKREQLEKILPSGERSYRSSKTNKYTSLTLRKKMQSSEEVIQVYKDAYGIEGIIAL